MRDLPKAMHERPAEPSSDQGSNSARQEGEAHVRALLSGGSQPRDVFVVAWRLNDLAQRQNKQREHRAPYGWPEGQDQPRNGYALVLQNPTSERRNRAREKIHREGEAYY